MSSQYIGPSAGTQRSNTDRFVKVSTAFLLFPPLTKTARDDGTTVPGPFRAGAVLVVTALLSRNERWHRLCLQTGQEGMRSIRRQLGIRNEFLTSRENWRNEQNQKRAREDELLDRNPRPPLKARYKNEYVKGSTDELIRTTGAQFYWQRREELELKALNNPPVERIVISQGELLRLAGLNPNVPRAKFEAMLERLSRPIETDHYTIPPVLEYIHKRRDGKYVLLVNYRAFEAGGPSWRPIQLPLPSKSHAVLNLILLLEGLGNATINPDPDKAIPTGALADRLGLSRSTYRTVYELRVILDRIVTEANIYFDRFDRYMEFSIKDGRVLFEKHLKAVQMTDEELEEYHRSERELDEYIASKQLKQELKSVDDDLEDDDDLDEELDDEEEEGPVIYDNPLNPAFR